MKERFAKNPDYVVCETHTRRLHALIGKGEGSSEAANLLRYEVEELWYGLDETEQYRLQRLSAELAMFYGKERPRPKTASQRQADRLNKMKREWQARREGIRPRNDAEKLRRHLAIDFARGAWESILEQLRIEPHALPAHLVAWYRGRAYRGLGHPETALEFDTFAVSVSEPGSLYQAAVLSDLIILGRNEEARQLVDRMMEDQSCPAFLRASAAITSVNLEITQIRENENAEDATRRLTQAVAVLEEVMQHERELAKMGRDALSIIANVSALSYVRLGERQKAIESYRRSLRLNQSDTSALAGLAYLLYESDRPAAVDLCRRAVEAHADVALPYTLLAHHFFTNQVLDRAWKFSDAACRLEKAGRLRAGLLVIRAISGASLGRPRSEVVSDFEEAIRLKPDDLKIAEAFREYKSTSASQTARLRPIPMGGHIHGRFELPPFELRPDDVTAGADFSRIAYLPLAGVG